MNYNNNICNDTKNPGIWKSPACPEKFTPGHIQGIFVSLNYVYYDTSVTYGLFPINIIYTIMDI